MSSLKVFIACFQKNNYIPDCEIIQPVQAGAALTNMRLPDMLADNTGDNISEKNARYCELTVQYWAWKNTDFDYYGFCHYRRFLSFNENLKGDVDNWNIIIRNYLNEASAQDLFLCQSKVDDIKNLVTQYDAISMKPSDLSKAGGMTVYEQYKKDGAKLHIEDIDVMLQIIKERYPEYYDTAVEYLNGYSCYIGNIFIMKKDIFHDYCEWLFDILGEFEKRVDMSSYSCEGYRTPGHLGERLCGIYYSWLKKQEGIKTHELPLVFFANTEKQEELYPAYRENNIPIAMVSNDGYAPFYATMIKSLLDYSSPQNNYDLVFLQRDFSKNTKKLFEKMIENYSNVSIRFFQVDEFFENTKLNTSSTIPIETYFKLVIPDIFVHYEKVLYLDGDMVIKTDVAELFNLDVTEYLLAAAKDVGGLGLVNGFDNSRMQYVKKYMRLENIYNQFNAGVLLINVKKMREQFSTQYLIKFAEGSAFQFQDQDVLNVLCENQVLWLEQTWNFVADEINGYRGYVDTFAPREIYLEYRKAAQKPKIIHFAGNEKPWYYPKQEWAEEFWDVFSKTPFYHGYIMQRVYEASANMTPRVDYAPISNLIDSSTWFKRTLRRIADITMPYGTERRERLKRLYKKIRHI